MAQNLYYNSSLIPRTSEVTDRIILTQYNQLNYCLNGLILDRVSLLIAPTNAGKSCFSSSLIIDAIKQGINTFLFAGEDGGAEARDRVYRQYLGADKNNYEYVAYVSNGKNTNAGENLIKPEKFAEAKAFFDDKLFIYNNNFPATRENLINCLTEAHTRDNCRFFVIDNCEMFNLDGEYYNENQAMKEICVALRQFAITKKCHILIISHIKKTERNICRPEIFDCKGTSSLTNIAKNILSLIRTDTINPNTQEYKDLAKIIELNGYKVEESAAVVEILKTKGRKNGIISLGFNAISNSYYERRKFGDPVDDKVVTYVPANKQEQLEIDSIF